MEISPVPVLAGFVQCFWRIETGGEFQPKQEEVFPDGCFDIVIYIRQRERNNVFLTGIWDRPVMVSTPPDSSIVGVRFIL